MALIDYKTAYGHGTSFLDSGVFANVWHSRKSWTIASTQYGEVENRTNTVFWIREVYHVTFEKRVRKIKPNGIRLADESEIKSLIEGENYLNGINFRED